MKKGLLLSLLAIVLVGIIIYAIWYINERGKAATGDKNAFIPYNSAIVIHTNSQNGAVLTSENSFISRILQTDAGLLKNVVDTLVRQSYANQTSEVMAIRVETRNKLAFLYVLENKKIASQGEIADFLRKSLGNPEEKSRKYDRYKIYTLGVAPREVYLSVTDGMILLSDSELYVEDALKQFDRESEETEKPVYANVNKYFSAGADVNIFLNTGCFADFLPLYVNLTKVSDNIGLEKWFKWGAMDGEVSDKSMIFNGFMHYSGLEQSYFSTFLGQRPKESGIDGIIPAHLSSFQSLNLSDFRAYLTALEQYRYDAGQKDKIRQRRAEYVKIFGSDVEADVNELVQGEFAAAMLGFDESKGEKDGVVVVQLKSGGLCTALVEKMLAGNARIVNVHPDSYKRSFSVDRDKSFTYYRFPAEDMAALFWGYVFDGIPGRYVMVVDNYMVLASSENAVRLFIQDYVRRNFIKDADWYRTLRSRLSAKYNMAYFAEMSSALPYYKHVTRNELNGYLNDVAGDSSFFSAVGAQWSNESDMLYSTILLSTEKFVGNERPHILWQTKLDAKMSMKPVPVQNHVTGEQELFVQDDNNTVYLINNTGRILWKLPLDGKINSEIYQVDVYKNGKLQYLFSTPSKMYLIDRNGNHIERFPMTFRSACTMGISMYDYDKDRNYRIFAPCEDRKIYLYGIDGNMVNGWDNGLADKEIVSKVNFYRVGDKDYIVFADRYRLYILDRKGKERVRVSTVFDLKDNTDIYLTKRGATPVLVFTNAMGPVNMVDFNGEVQTVKCGELSAEHRLNVGDVDCDGKEEFVFTNGNKLSVYNSAGKLMFEKQIEEARSLDYPYIYRFSGNDSRIGLVDAGKHRMFLLTKDGTVSRGFPINGDSPFSIAFFGNEGFYLFAGADDGTLIKYKVQR